MKLLLEVKQLSPGKYFNKIKTFKLNSLTSNFAYTLYCQLSRQSVQIRDVTNQLETWSSTEYMWMAECYREDDTYGILLGLSATATTFLDYKLNSKILEGTELNQLNYWDTLITVSTPPPPNNLTINIVRSITNNSGANIQIRELGLFYKIGDLNVFMIDHSLFSFNFLDTTVQEFTYKAYF